MTIFQPFVCFIQNLNTQNILNREQLLCIFVSDDNNILGNTQENDIKHIIKLEFKGFNVKFHKNQWLNENYNNRNIFVSVMMSSITQYPKKIGKTNL